MCAAWIFHLLRSCPVSCCRICLSGTPIGSPNRLLIDYNCFSVVAQWAMLSECSLLSNRNLELYPTHVQFQKSLSEKLDMPDHKPCTGFVRWRCYVTVVNRGNVLHQKGDASTSISGSTMKWVVAIYGFTSPREQRTHALRYFDIIWMPLKMKILHLSKFAYPWRGLRKLLVLLPSS